MVVLGISGLDGAMAFKRRQWPGLEEREYRISQGNDSAAALVRDGEIVAAAAEERFTGRKHTGKFPSGAIAFCLAEAGVGIGEVDGFVHAFDYTPYRALHSLDPVTALLHDEVLSREALLKLVSERLAGLPPERVHSLSHHVAHAASAYYTSGWDECLVVVMDGMGEVEGATIFLARDGRLRKIGGCSAANSIGVLYSLVTLHLGFDFAADEYKTMGLAPYGDPARHRAFFDEAVLVRDDGTVRIPILSLNRTREEREQYLTTRRYLTERLGEARRPEDEIASGHCDIAAALQECLERAVLHVCTHYLSSTGVSRLALVGGVALNCVANGRLLRAGIAGDIYIQPAAGDDGAALGAALYHSAQMGVLRNVRMPTPFLGPDCPADAVAAAFAARSDFVQVDTFASLTDACDEAARRIHAGQVLAWCRGRMEYGPRALGNRSILADPGRPEMRDRINALVKRRESFRPFAPAVSVEQGHRWFEIRPGTELPYMLATVYVRAEHREQLPAITHVNGSARVQTVSCRDNPEFHALLRAVGRITGREMVLNTSFNVKGQPMVNTPLEAIDTFLSTGIDCLFLEDNLVTRRQTPRT